MCCYYEQVIPRVLFVNHITIIYIFMVSMLYVNTYLTDIDYDSFGFFTKGHTTVLQFNRFQESRHHDVIGTQICQSKLIH